MSLQTVHAPPTACVLVATVGGGKLSFAKRSQLFLHMHNEPVSVAAMCVCNPELLALGETIAETQPKLQPA
jgi:hypothetical protein